MDASKSTVKSMDVSEQIEKFQDFIDVNYKKELHNAISKGKRSLILDFSKLFEFEPDLADLVLDDPEETVKAAEMSLDNFDLPNAGIRIRFTNIPKTQEIKIRDIRSEHLGKFLTFEGIVRQSSDVRPQVVSAKFECPSCGNTITILQLESRFKEPSRCSCGRRGKFRLIAKDLVDAQRLVIEEAPERLEGGEQPKRLSVFLKEDLVEPKMEKKTTPGSKVKIIGIIKEVPVPLKSGMQSTRYDLIAETNNIESVEQTFEDIEISKEDEEEILLLSKDKNVYKKLANSIAPGIYGHEDIKTALILQLMGGVKKERKDGTFARGDLHILLVGDPGSAKSSLLISISKIAPKARYIAGRSVSGAGITATIVRDEFLRGWALEAGAMVLANKGVLTLDEMDKMSTEDTAALHEAMAQQTISISKANIQACYSSDTAVLTDKGWKNYLEVKDSKLAQYDPKTGAINFISNEGLFIYDYHGLMYHFSNKRNDILVTPNHRMLAKERSQKDYAVFEAKNLKYSYIKFLNSANYTGIEKKYFILPPIKHRQNRKHIKYVHQYKSKKIPMNLWLEFLGYYVTEGGIERKKNCPGIGFVQKLGSNARKIKNCLSKLSEYVGFTLTEMRYDPYIRFKITNLQLTTYLDTTCGKNCYERRLPLDVLCLHKKQLKILYDAMMLGDGSSDGKSFTSTSLELIDIFQIVACFVGKSANKHVQYKEGYRGNRVKTYRVSLCDTIEPSIRKRYIKKISYNGKVFCFSTKTGFFITRRNGKIAIQGNTLRCETTVLAAANPKLGRFDPFQPIAAQINLPPALINRFDLIFPVRDIPNKELDEKIAKHVLELHQDIESKQAEIPMDFMKKYISYARQKISPKLTNVAITEIKSFYVALRNTGQSDEDEIKPIPISARQLEALVRLAEGSARLRLSNKVTKEDAKRAIELLKHCLMQVGFDYETGKIDIDRISTGISAFQRSKIVIIRDLINELTKRGENVSMDDLISLASEKNIEEEQVEEVIERLKREGEIFEPRKNIISKVR